jgi:hypothetical protein
MIKAANKGPRQPQLDGLRSPPGRDADPAAAGSEVLMLRQAQTPRSWRRLCLSRRPLDPEDHSAHRVVGLTEAQANERLKVSSGGIAYYVATIRECFEEAGILLARDASGAPISPERAEKLLHWRKKPFRNMLEAEDLYVGR